VFRALPTASGAEWPLRRRVRTPTPLAEEYTPGSVTLANSVVSDVLGTTENGPALLDSTVPLWLENTSFVNVYAPSDTLVRAECALAVTNCHFRLVVVLQGVRVSEQAEGVTLLHNCTLRQVTTGSAFLSLSAAVQVRNVSVTDGVGRFLLADYQSPTAAALVAVSELRAHNMSLLHQAFISVSSYEILTQPATDPFVVTDSVFSGMPEHSLMVYTNGYVCS
jgi:hypothetical protein